MPVVWILPPGESQRDYSGSPQLLPLSHGPQYCLCVKNSCFSIRQFSNNLWKILSMAHVLHYAPEADVQLLDFYMLILHPVSLVALAYF